MSARKNGRKPPGRRQDGVAAVEMALLSIVMALILLAPIMVARFLMQATLIQRAAFNAVHMIATYPQYERLNTASTPVENAQAMATEALVEGGVASSATFAVVASCPGSVNCSGKLTPTSIDIDIAADVLDPTSVLPMFRTVTITSSASDRYAN